MENKKNEELELMIVSMGSHGHCDNGVYIK